MPSKKATRSTGSQRAQLVLVGTRKGAFLLRSDAARREWPASVRALAGAWADLPSAEKIRRSHAKDIARGRL